MTGESTRGARASSGGVAARRAVVRWAWRMFRREWRQQLLVLALLIVAVAATIVAASAAYNTAAGSDDAEFGTAGHLLTFETAGSDAWRGGVAAAEEWFGTVDVIRRWYESVPGSVETVEFRAQDPEGAFGGPMLALRDGRYPSGAREVAVTDWVAETFELDLGTVFDLDGVERPVVGIVENPNDLDGEFALVAPTDQHAPDSVTILLGRSSEPIDAFLGANELGPDDGSVTVGSRSGEQDVEAALVVLGTATVALVLVALVAAAGFAVVAQRRLRQLGMLGAIGATEKHLRLVMVASGAVTGVVAAVIGAAAGLVTWIAVEPPLEGAVARRIDPSNVPWWLVTTASLLAVATATAAAWWPARAVARVPVTSALSGRPPNPRSVRGSAALAGLLLVVGTVCLVRSDRTSALLIIAGTLATVAGVLLASPLAIRLLARLAAWLPVAVRLALRDLARHQARSGVALAAISLVLGVPVAIVVTAAAAEPGPGEGNLAADQLLIRMGDPDDPDAPCPGPVQAGDTTGILGGGSGPCPFLPERTPAELASMEDQVDRIAAQLDGSEVTVLDVAFDPAVDPGPDGRPVVTLAQEMGGDVGLLDVSLLYVATPDLLEHYGLDPEQVESHTEVLSVEAGELWLVGMRSRGTDGFVPETVRNVERLDPTYSSLPGTFITPAVLRQRGWEAGSAGWLVQTGSPLTEEQFDAARDLAASAGLIVEARDEREGLVTLRSRATAAGILLALAVLAMTVGLIRGEAAGDLRTLTATGATSTTRRTLTAATAGGLAVLGVALGTTGAYVALAAGYFDEVGNLSPVPVLHIVVIAAGVPLVAAGAGWLLAGREPRSLVRRPIE